MSGQAAMQEDKKPAPVVHGVSLDQLLTKLLSDHPPAIYVDGNRQIAVSALRIEQDFRFGDDDDGIVYRLIGETRTLYVSQLLSGNRFRHGTTWYQLVDTKFHFVELSGNSPTGRPATDRRGPLDVQEAVTRMRLRLKRN